MAAAAAAVAPEMRITGGPLLHHPGNAVVGISRSQSADEVLVTVQSAGLMLQTLSEQVTTASITSPSSRRFQCPAVQHSGKGSVYAALSSPPEIRVWDGMQHGFADAASTPLSDQGEVHSLHTATTIDGVVVVFSDGTAEVLPRSGFTPPDDHRAATSGRGKRKRRKRDVASVLWAELLIDHKTATTRLLLLSREGSGAVCISSREVTSEPQIGLPRSRVLETPSCGCLAACFQWPGSLYTLWEDGTLWAADIGKGGAGLGGSDGAAAAADPLPSVQSGAFRGFTPEDQGDRPGVAVMVASTTSHLALLVKMGEPTALRGFLWDTAYSTLQADADVGRFTGVKWSTKDAVTGAVGRGAGCAIFSSSGTVVALNFPAAAAVGTLAAAINKAGMSRLVVTDSWADKTAAAVTHFVPAWPVSTKDGRRAVDAIDRQRAAADALVATVLKLSACPTSAALDKAVQKCIEALSEPTERATDGGLQHHVISMVRRCLDEKRYFGGAAIERLLALQCLSFHHCADVFYMAIDRKRRSLLRACLVHLDGITEPDMLRCFSELHSRNGEAPAAPTEGTAETELQEFLRLAYSRGWNEEELIEAIQPVALDGIIFIIKNLRWWLARLNEASAAEKSDAATAVIPTQAQILDWTCAVIDAKFATLIHSIESHELIREINGLLQQQHELCEQMMGMAGLLGRFMDGKALPRSHAEIGPYSIEVLEL